MPLSHRRLRALSWLLVGCLSLTVGGCASTEQEPASGSISRHTQPEGGEQPAGAKASEEGSDQPSPPPAGQGREGGEDPSPSLEPAPTPTSAKAMRTLADYRASGLWSGLASAQQAGGIVRATMNWRNTEGIVAAISNGDQLWSQTMPSLRDHLLTRHLRDAALPEVVFVGTPFAATHAVHVVTWWTNGPTGTNGRGQLLIAFAGWKDTQGVAHVDLWPILIGKGTGGVGTSHAGRLLGVGPMHTLVVGDLGQDQQPAFDLISGMVRPWVDEQPVTQDPIELPCPPTGCVN